LKINSLRKVAAFLNEKSQLELAMTKPLRQLLENEGLLEFFGDKEIKRVKANSI
jgi:hypothetical protein